MTDDLGKDLRHPHRQRRRPASATKQRVFTDIARERIHVFHRHRKTQRRDFRGSGGGFTLHVHGEINARIHRASGDDCHDRHQRFQTHRPVTNRSRVTFPRDDLRCRAARDQRVKTRDRAARNRDEAERKQLPRHNQTGAVHELRDGWHLQIRQHQKNPHRQREDRSQFHERAEIIARREQQPHRQNTCRQTVADDCPRQ